MIIIVNVNEKLKRQLYKTLKEQNIDKRIYTYPTITDNKFKNKLINEEYNNIWKELNNKALIDLISYSEHNNNVYILNIEKKYKEILYRTINTKYHILSENDVLGIIKNNKNDILFK